MKPIIGFAHYLDPDLLLYGRIYSFINLQREGAELGRPFLSDVRRTGDI